MDDKTTTDAPVETGGQTVQGVEIDANGSAVPQPETTDSAEAVETTETPEQASTDAPEPSKDDNSEWLKNKGIDPSDPDAINKLAKAAREAERAMHNKAQKASELEKTMGALSDESAEAVAEQTGADPELLKRVQRMEVKDSVRNFFDGNPDAKPFESEMIAEIAKGQLAGSAEAVLEAAYAIALKNNVGGLKSQAKKETLTNLAQKQQAAQPRGAAVTSASASSAITPQNVDAMVAGMSHEEYRKRLPEINAAMAG